MPSKSERTFGARLRKTQDVVQFTKVWKGYNPPRSSESVIEMEAFLEQVIATNERETKEEGNYTAAVAARQQHFRKKEGSIEKLITQIKGSVVANFGNASTETKQVIALIRKIRSTKLVKPPKDPANPDVQEAISNSQRSYGSVTQFFADMITNVEQMQGYTASNPTLTVDGLKQKLTEVRASNDAVASTLQEMRTIRASRMDQYLEMAERVIRIKAYAKAQYGIRSTEYKSISNIRI